MQELRNGRQTIAGVDLHFVEAGGGEAVLLLHGWPLSWYSWRKVIPELARKYRVIAPDLPGLGDSGAAEDYAKHRIAKILHEFAMSLGLGKLRLVGHDMGAPIAYAYARQFPEDVRQLAILDVPIGGFGLDEFGRRLHLWHFDFFRTEGVAEALVTGREEALIRAFYPRYAPDAITEADIAEYARTYAQPGALERSLAYYRAFAADEAWNHEASGTKLAMPVLAIGGEFAGAGSPFESMTHLATDVTGRVLAGCGHYLAEEAPAALLRELHRFFEQER
jgi:pimeloyl-ACP methyl ester carboxylesterase